MIIILLNMIRTRLILMKQRKNHYKIKVEKAKEVLADTLSKPKS